MEALLMLFFILPLFVCMVAGFVILASEIQEEKRANECLAHLAKTLQEEYEKEREALRKKQEEAEINWKEIEKEFGNACNQRFQR